MISVKVCGPSSTKSKNQAGYAILAMTFVAATIIAMMLVVANQSFNSSAASRSKVKEQLAALDVMKDLAVMIRRSYDMAQTNNGICPAGSYVAHSPELRDSAGVAVPLCFPIGIDSCLAHPMDPDPPLKEQWVDTTTNPVLCFEFAAPRGQRVNISFRVNPETSKTAWLEFRKSWLQEAEEVIASAGRIVASANPIPKAQAQELADREPWYPREAVIAVGGLALSSDNPPPHASRTCTDDDTLCITYSACLRMSGCRGSAEARPLEEFVQTVGLER